MPVIKKTFIGNFTVVHNSVLKERKLSLAALGLLCKMLSYPEDFVFKKEDFRKYGGRQKIDKIISELKIEGYLYQFCLRNNETNKIIAYPLIASPVKLSVLQFQKSLSSKRWRKKIIENYDRLRFKKKEKNDKKVKMIELISDYSHIKMLYEKEKNDKNNLAASLLLKDLKSIEKKITCLKQTQTIAPQEP